MTANAAASFDKPAYFAVKTGTGTSTITAFHGTSWTSDYTVNGGAVTRVSDKDKKYDETITTSDATNCPPEDLSDQRGVQAE